MPRKAAERTRVDPELGPVRWCGGCADWLPDDEEFWFYSVYRAGDVRVVRGRPYVRRTDGLAATCKACQADRNAAGHVRRRQRLAPLHLCHRPPNVPRCPVLVPHGRTSCAGHEGRFRGPLTVAMLAEYGLAA